MILAQSSLDSPSSSARLAGSTRWLLTVSTKARPGQQCGESELIHLRIPSFPLSLPLPFQLTNHIRIYLSKLPHKYTYGRYIFMVEIYIYGRRIKSSELTCTSSPLLIISSPPALSEDRTQMACLSPVLDKVFPVAFPDFRGSYWIKI